MLNLHYYSQAQLNRKKKKNQKRNTPSSSQENNTQKRKENTKPLYTYTPGLFHPLCFQSKSGLECQQVNTFNCSAHFPSSWWPLERQ